MTLTRYEIFVQKKNKNTHTRTHKIKICLTLLAKNSLENNENFFVQRLHHYWRVLAGKYTVENDFCESRCFAMKINLQ